MTMGIDPGFGVAGRVCTGPWVTEAVWTRRWMALTNPPPPPKPLSG